MIWKIFVFLSIFSYGWSQSRFESENINRDYLENIQKELCGISKKLDVIILIQKNHLQLLTELIELDYKIEEYQDEWFK